MINELEKAIQIFENHKIQILACSPQYMEETLYEISENNLTSLYIIGGIESKCIIFSVRDINAVFVYSVNQNISHNKSIMNNCLKIELITPQLGWLINADNIIFRLKNRKKVCLISLAKTEIYTFPRFALGISYIANSLREQNLSVVSLFDLQFMTTDDIISEIKYIVPDIIGISMTFGLFDVMEELVERLKLLFPKTKIVIGGSLATIEYSEILCRFPELIISLGEGEETWPQLMQCLYEKSDLSVISNIAYSLETITVTNRTFPVHQFSLPVLDLLIPTIESKGVFQLETSRGCYNACSFCPRHHKGLWKPIVDENSFRYFIQLYVDYLRIYNFEATNFVIYIVDEEFVGSDCTENRKRINTITSILLEYSIRFEISFRMTNVYTACSSQDDNFEKIEFLKQLKKNGLNRVLVGVESGVDTVLKRFNKNVTVRENIIGIRLLTALGIPVRFTYITFDPLMNL